jgi:zinc D-Ala-D-Ala carboxypeptidase
MSIFKYFKDSEIVGLDLGLVQMLDRARQYAEIPFIITSGYRSPEYEIGKGRSENGPHTTRKAVDLKCTNSRERFLILKALFYTGFLRIGDEKDHIHADICNNKDINVVWLE